MRPMIKTFIYYCVLAGVNAACMCISIALKRDFWWFSLMGLCFCIYAAVDALVSDRKLKRQEELFRREQQFYNEYIAKRKAEAGKEPFYRLHSPDLPREPKRRGSGEKTIQSPALNYAKQSVFAEGEKGYSRNEKKRRKCEKWLINLALYHPKARVRKKNANRIIKMQGKERR